MKLKKRTALTTACAMLFSAALFPADPVYAHAQLMDDGTYYFGGDHEEMDQYTYKNFEHFVLAMQRAPRQIDDQHYGWDDTSSMTDEELADIIGNYIYVAQNETYESTVIGSSFAITVDHMNKVLDNTLGWHPSHTVTGTYLTTDGTYYYVPGANGEGYLDQMYYRYFYETNGETVAMVDLLRYWWGEDYRDGVEEVVGTYGVGFTKDSNSAFGWHITWLLEDKYM